MPQGSKSGRESAGDLGCLGQGRPPLEAAVGALSLRQENKIRVDQNNSRGAPCAGVPLIQPQGFFSKDARLRWCRVDTVSKGESESFFTFQMGGGVSGGGGKGGGRGKRGGGARDARDRGDGVEGGGKR